jgi:hypothetical protein
LPRAQRAQFFHGMLTFRVSPGSILAMNASEQKMLRLQLSRQGYLDFWTLLEALEIPNVGQPPMTPLPVIGTPDPNEVLASLTANGGLGDGHYIMAPNGQLLEVRMPSTITERLVAQQSMGIGMQPSPAGRKASAQQPPHDEAGKKDQTGAPRNTVSESSK